MIAPAFTQSVNSASLLFCCLFSPVAPGLLQLRSPRHVQTPEKAIEEVLRFAFFIAFEMVLTVADKFFLQAFGVAGMGLVASQSRSRRSGNRG